MRAHHIVDLIDGNSGRSKALLEPVKIEHIPEWTCRTRLVVADAAIDQNIMVRRLHQVGLDAQHQPSAFLVEITTFCHPSAIFLQHLLSKRWEKFQRFEE